MPKYVITRKRTVVQNAVFELDVPEADDPMHAAEGIDPGTLDWKDVDASYMSTDVAPVPGGGEPQSE